MRNATLLLLLLAGPAVAQKPPPQLPPNTAETQLFRGLFHFHKIEPESVANLQRGGYDYSKLIVVVLGNSTNNPTIAEHCRNTLANGGAVLVAADSSVNLAACFPRRGALRVAGLPARNFNPDVLDQGYASRPLVGPTATAGTSPWAGVRRVATDGPSHLSPMGANDRPAGLGLQLAAVLPDDTEISLGGQPIKLDDVPFAYATADDTLPVKFMVLADPDVFGNRMIYTSGREENPTDNLKFANSTVQWLKGTQGRTRCLFIENGNVKDIFDEFEFSSIPVGPDLPPPPIPNIDLMNPDTQRRLGTMVNTAVDEVQRRDMVNRGIGGSPERRWVVIAVLATLLAFLAYAVVRWRAVTGWFRRTFRPLPRDPAMLGPDVAVGSVGHRRLELLRTADYGPVLREYVRRLFQDRGLPAEYTASKLPHADIAVRNPKFLREALAGLWAVVNSSAPVSYGRWRQLEPLLAAVRAAADDDKWRFAAAPRDTA